MTDAQAHQLSIDRSRPGIWTVSISNPPINMFFPTTIVELGGLMTGLEQALRSRVAVERDESFSTIAAAVEITTADGKVHTLKQAAARGSDANPLSDRDLEGKLRMLAAGWNPHYDVAPLIDAIWALDRSADAGKLASLAVLR